MLQLHVVFGLTSSMIPQAHLGPTLAKFSIKHVAIVRESQLPENIAHSSKMFASLVTISLSRHHSTDGFRL